MPVTCFSYLNHGLRVRGMLCPVIYRMTVTVTKGAVTVRHDGLAPDGEYMITGHEDEGSSAIAVARFHPDGRAAGRASSEHDKGK